MIDGVRILLGSFASEPFALGLAGLLAATGEFGPILPVDADDLGQLVGDGQPSIVILEGSDPLAYRWLLEQAPHIALVMLGPDRAPAVLQLQNPSWAQLYRVIRTVAEHLGAGSPVEARIGVIEPPPAAPRPLSPVGSDDGFDDTVDWLNLSLARPLLALSANQAASGIPGWSIAPREALALLGQAGDELTPAQLEAQHHSADAVLISDRRGLPPALEQLAARLALSDDELRMLLLILAPEIDGRYGTAIGVLQDDLTRRRPGLTLLATLLGMSQPAWELRRQLDLPDSVQRLGLVEPAAGATGTGVDSGYAPTGALIAYLLAGPGRLPNGLAGGRLVPAGTTDQADAADAAVAARLDEVLAGVVPRPLIHLPGVGADTWFPRVAAALGHPTIQVDLGLTDREQASAAAVTDWCRLGFLHDAGLLVTGLDPIPEPERHRVEATLAAEAGRLRFVAVAGILGEERIGSTPIVRVTGPREGPIEQAAAWVAEAEAAGLPLQLDEARRLSAMGSTSPVERRTSLALFAASRPEPDDTTVDGVQRALRQLRRRTLPPVIRRIEAVYGWDDLVLTEAVKDVLRMIPGHMIHAGQVLDEWRFAQRLPYGQGVAALFSGPSGTGKTMAAQIIAGELGVDLFQVDLSKVVSKYIGETEKNLDQVFDLAERDGAVLLFDEADALFGKRTEVRDAHDKHANVEVAYLLQRMEAFAGLAVLTTNLKQNIDNAFLRRLRFVVELPMPSAAEREAIWRRSFPPAAPLSPDLDLAFLARRLPLTGGSIQQIALHAAFAAASAGRAIGMAEVVEASRRELLKIGLLNAEKALDDLAA